MTKLKSAILTVREYWTFWWNRFDFGIVVISVAEPIVSYVIAALVSNEIRNTDTKTSNFKSIKVLKVIKFIKVLQTVRTLRTIRMLRFSKTLVPMIMKRINGKIYAKTSFGYEVGRGFIQAGFSLMFWKYSLWDLIELEGTEIEKFNLIRALEFVIELNLDVLVGNSIISGQIRQNRKIFKYF